MAESKLNDAVRVELRRIVQERFTTFAGGVAAAWNDPNVAGPPVERRHRPVA